MDTELREYIELKMDNLLREVTRLSGVVANQSALINDINIKSTTRVAELQKDIDDLRSDLKDVRNQVREVDESQKLRWKDRESKDRLQAVTNSQVDDMKKILWLILSTTVITLIGLIATWVVNGGLQRLTP